MSPNPSNPEPIDPTTISWDDLVQDEHESVDELSECLRLPIHVKQPKNWDPWATMVRREPAQIPQVEAWKPDPSIFVDKAGSPTYQKERYAERKRTCRKAWLFTCSAWSECGTELLIIAGDAAKAERLVRDQHWSALTGLGWTCPDCTRIYRSDKGNIGPRKTQRKYRRALTRNEMRLVREHKMPAPPPLTVQEMWQIREQQEHQNDRGEYLPD